MADSVYRHDDITVKQEPTSPRNNLYSSSPVSSSLTLHYVNNHHYRSSNDKHFKDSPPNLSPARSPTARTSMVPSLVSQRQSQSEDNAQTNGTTDSDACYTDESLDDAPLDFSIKRKLHHPKSRLDFDDEPGLLRQFPHSPERSPPNLNRNDTIALSRPVFPSTSPYSLPHPSTMATTSLSGGTAYIASSNGEGSHKNTTDSRIMHHKTYVTDLINNRKRHDAIAADSYASSSSSSSPDTSSNSHPLTNHASRKRRTSPIGEPRAYQTTAFPGSATAALSPLSVIPGLPPGMVPNPALMGTLPSISAFYDPRNSHHISVDGNKNIRPFKSYPKDPLSLPLGLYGIPGCMPFPNVDANTIASINKTTDELYDMYQHQIHKLHEIESRKRGRSNNGVAPSSPPATSGMSSPELPPVPARNSSPLSSSNHHQALPASVNHHHIHHSHSSKNSIINHNNNNIYSEANSVSSALNVGTITTTSGATSSGRKRPRSLPDEQKDEAYWERRRKNNEAAKRSRDSRRAKEDEIAIRAALLEQENLKLRVEVAALKNETAKLRCMLYNS